MTAGRALRIGVVGLGDIATKAYLPVLAGRADLELTLMSRDPGRVARVSARFGAPRATTRLEDLLDAGLDAAFVHASTEAHVGLVERLLGAGLHVLVDKPLAPSLDDATRLVELAESARRSLAVGFNRRHAPVYADLAGLPRSVVLVQKHRVGLPDEPRRVVFDDFIHVVDTLRFLLGDGPDDDGPVDDGPDDDGPDDGTRLDVRAVVHDGLLRTVTLGMTAGGVTGVGVMNRVSGSAEEVVEVLGAGHKHRVVDMAQVERHDDGGVRLLRRGDWTPVPEQRGFAALCEWFLTAVREQRVLSARDALRTHEICEQVVAAAEPAGGRPVLARAESEVIAPGGDCGRR